MLTAAVLVTAGTVPAKAAERGRRQRKTQTPISRRSPSLRNTDGCQDRKDPICKKTLTRKAILGVSLRFLRPWCDRKSTMICTPRSNSPRHAVNSIDRNTHIGIGAGEEIAHGRSVRYHAGIRNESLQWCSGAYKRQYRKFADLMNKQRKIGCRSHFMNPNGLHNDKHYVTVVGYGADLAESGSSKSNVPQDRMFFPLFYVRNQQGEKGQRIMEPPQDGKTDDVFIQRRGGRKDWIYDQSRRYSR